MVTLLLMRRRLYWRLRQVGQRWLLRIDWWRFRLARTARERRAEGGVVSLVVIQASVGMVLSAAIVGGLQLVSTLVGLIATSRPELPLLALLSSAPGNGFVELLVLVPSVAGIVLGLYFASLTTLFEARYGKVPAQVRALVTNDRVGRTYVGLLSTAIGTSLLLLLQHIGNIDQTRVHALGVGLIGLVAFFGFAALGRRAFDFLDPLRLMEPVLADLYSVTRTATAMGYRFQAVEYQQLYHRQAQDGLDTLETLFKLAQTEEQRRNEPLERVAWNIPSLLSWYLNLKPAIPSDSLWFLRVAHHRRWYLSDVAGLDVSTHLRVSLPPDEGIDRFWYENRLTKLLEQEVIDALSRGQWELLARLLNVVAQTCRVLGQSWSISRSEEWIQALAKPILAQAEKSAVNSHPGELLWVHNAVDSLALVRISVTLGFRDRVRQLAAVDFEEHVRKVKWTDYSSIRTYPGSFALAAELDRLRAQMIFEFDVYGSNVTPTWYLTEELARHLFVQLRAAFAEVLALPAAPFRLTESGPGAATLIAGALGSRGLEHAARTSELVPHVEQLRTHLREYERSRYLRWPVWDDTKYEIQAQETFKARSEDVASLIAALAELPVDKMRVDYLGEAVSLTGEECFVALTQGQHDHFARLFHEYFRGCLAVCEQLQKNADDWDEETYLVIWSEPLMDLFAISGYSLIYAMLRRNVASWQLVRSAWDRYLRGNAERLKLMRVAFELHDPLTGLRPRALLRARWDQHLRADLMAFAEEPPWPPSPFTKRLQHRKRLVRAIGQTMFADGEEVFAALYLWRGEPLASRPGRLVRTLEFEMRESRPSRRRHTTGLRRPRTQQAGAPAAPGSRAERDHNEQDEDAGEEDDDTQDGQDSDEGNEA